MMREDLSCCYGAGKRFTMGWPWRISIDENSCTDGDTGSQLAAVDVSRSGRKLNNKLSVLHFVHLCQTLADCLGAAAGRGWRLAVRRRLHSLLLPQPPSRHQEEDPINEEPNRRGDVLKGARALQDFSGDAGGGCCGLKEGWGWTVTRGPGPLRLRPGGGRGELMKRDEGWAG